MRRIHKLIYSLSIAIPVAALASCSSGGSTASVATGPPPEQSTITVDAVPTADEAGLYIAQDNGYFAQQGLTVKIVPIFGGELGLPDLQDGKAQMVVGNYVSFIQAQIAGKFGLPGKTPSPINIRIIADGSLMQPGNQALYVMPNSRYKTVAELAAHHAKIGVNTPNNIGQVLLGSLFRENGLTMNPKNVSYNQFPVMPQMLKAGQLNAAWLPEPFGTIAGEKYGEIPIADFDQGSLQNFPIGAYIGSTQWIQKNPNTVAAFLRALQEGQQVADTNRAAVEQALIKNAPGTTPLIAATMTLDTYPLSMDVPVMQRVSDAMFEFGLEPGFKQPYQITNMIEPEPGEILK
jgi:NitT/TauT family transport system substrate-binding protein